ncbi:MAG: DUF72 domain-containing protein [Elusimicrobiota bacterium]
MIKIGTSGFSFPDWVGSVYPTDLKKQDMLKFYQEQLGFNISELNFTYYSLPSSKTLDSLNKKTSRGFKFTVKAFKGMTHDPFDPSLQDKPDKEKTDEYFKYFRSSIDILNEAGKLGAVLFQFPVFFKPSPSNMEYLFKAKDKMRDIPVAVEFRNSKWNNSDTFDFLEKNHITYCAVDEPSLPSLVPFAGKITSDIGYIRLHGRNKKWFNSSVKERYNYLYSKQELEEFIPHIRDMDKKAKEVFVFFNNCHGGKAAVNAKMMRDMLGIDFEPKQKELF